ncbi:serine O-acetyltransferase [Sedimentitalea sp. XS_ASV28]|uniref:serine O-acetyltransferase n=1 Tax=Sedimentitalea sp. XS_ASV28 TaxID=3241296 RepID=UPI0035170882
MTCLPTLDVKSSRVARPLGADNCNPDTIGLPALIAEDFRTHGRDWLSEGFWVLFWHRFGNWRMGLPKLFRAPMTLIYRIMFRWVSRSTGILLPYTVEVGRRVCLEHFGGMILVAQKIGDDVTIRQNTTFGIARMDEVHSRPIIGDRVEIGAGAVIVGAIRIGNDAIVGANAVVTRDVLPGMVVGGIPARVIGQTQNLKADEQMFQSPDSNAS